MNNINYDALISELKNNNMNAVFAKDCSEACKIVRQMLFDGCSIFSGGSMSLIESGVWDIINEPRYKYFDRSRDGVYKEAIDGDFYFCSCNAITEKGELFNVDGFANRISAIAFGPKKVIMIVGKNKIVPDLKAAVMRLKTDAAPKNCVRLGVDTPCSKLGHCIALEKGKDIEMTDGCKCEKRICADYLISAQQRIKNRINIILVDENLGY